MNTALKNLTKLTQEALEKQQSNWVAAKKRTDWIDRSQVF
jgi:hypothetical protein